MVESEPYNPLDTKNLGKSVKEALLESAMVPLGSLTRFSGSGIYAIYYAGGFPAYEHVRVVEGREKAVYVGKSDPEGTRKGGGKQGTSKSDTKLFQRLRQHANSIEAAENLLLKDFFCRYLVVEPIWIPLGESLLIAHHTPIWNTYLDGFGSHDPGSGRRNGKRSRWDTVHPGRSWASGLQNNPDSAEQLVAEIYAQTAI